MAARAEGLAEHPGRSSVGAGVVLRGRFAAVLRVQLFSGPERGGERLVLFKGSGSCLGNFKLNHAWLCLQRNLATP